MVTVTDRQRGFGGRLSVAALAPVAVALIALGLILPTVMPGVGFWDTAEFQTVPPILGTAHPTGYPSYVLLGWVASAVLTPLGEAAYRMNLLSAILVAAAGAITVVLVRLLTGSTAVGVAAGIGLSVTPLAWGIGTHADPHALHLALFALLLLLLVRWEVERRRASRSADRWLVAATATFAVAAANHSLTLLLVPAIGLYVLAVEPGILRRPRLVATCGLVLVATMTALYLELPLRAGPFRAPLVYGNPATWDGFRYVVLAEQFRGGISDPFGHLDRKVIQLVGLVVNQVGGLAPLVPVGFLATVRREPRFALLTGIAFVITVFFDAAYVNADISRYYLGPILIVWVWLAILAATITDQVAGRLAEPDDAGELDPNGIALRPGASGSLAPAVVTLVVAAALLVPSAIDLPARADAADHSQDRTPSVWLDEALTSIQPNAVVVSWWSFSTPLWYAQLIEGRRTDIDVVDDRTRLDRNLGDVTDVIDANLGRRPVYVIRASDAELAPLAARYSLQPATSFGGLYLVRAATSAAR